MPLKLYHVRHSRSFRPLWLMLEMGLPHELETLPLDRSYFASPEWRRISPTGKVPALTDGDLLLTESCAILEYLCGRHGPTPLGATPQDADFGEWLQWIHYAEAGVARYIGPLIWSRQNDPDFAFQPGHVDYLRREIDVAQEVIVSGLEGRDHLLDRGFSAADIAMGYTLHLARLAGFELRDELAAYFDRLSQRPAFRAAAAAGRTG